MFKYIKINHIYICVLYMCKLVLGGNKKQFFWEEELGQREGSFSVYFF